MLDLHRERQEWQTGTTHEDIKTPVFWSWNLLEEEYVGYHDEDRMMLLK